MTWVRRIGQLLADIDPESVRPYQAWLYSGYLMAGIWVAIAGVPGPVDLALGREAGIAWIVALISAPLATFAGRYVEIRARNLPSRYLCAFILQQSGDAGIMLSSWTFAAALATSIYAGRAVFAAWVIGVLGACALAMILLGWRKLIHRVRDAREIVRGCE